MSERRSPNLVPLSRSRIFLGISSLAMLAILTQLTDAATFLIAVKIQGSYQGEINPLVHFGGAEPVIFMKLLWCIAVASFSKIYPERRWWLLIPVAAGLFGTVTNLYYLFTEVL